MKLITFAFVMQFIITCWPKTDIITMYKLTCDRLRIIIINVGYFVTSLLSDPPVHGFSESVHRAPSSGVLNPEQVTAYTKPLPEAVIGLKQNVKGHPRIKHKIKGIRP